MRTTAWSSTRSTRMRCVACSTGSPVGAVAVTDADGRSRLVAVGTGESTSGVVPDGLRMVRCAACHGRAADDGITQLVGAEGLADEGVGTGFRGGQLEGPLRPHGQDADVGIEGPDGPDGDQAAFEIGEARIEDDD